MGALLGWRPGRRREAIRRSGKMTKRLLVRADTPGSVRTFLRANESGMHSGISNKYQGEQKLQQVQHSPNCGKPLKLDLPSVHGNIARGSAKGQRYGKNGQDVTMGYPQPSPNER